MSAALVTPYLLLTAAAALSASPASYSSVGGTFTSSPDAVFSAPSRVGCAAWCTAMKPWPCGVFTYHPDAGVCQLYRRECVNLGLLQVDTGADHISYRRDACPGEQRRTNRVTCNQRRIRGFRARKRHEILYCSLFLHAFWIKR